MSWLALVPLRVRTVVDGDHAPVKPLPDWLAELGRDAANDALGTQAAPPTPYDIALINFYDADARMGMHRDSDEKSGVPRVRPDTAPPVLGLTGRLNITRRVSGL